MYTVICFRSSRSNRRSKNTLFNRVFNDKGQDVADHFHNFSSHFYEWNQTVNGRNRHIIIYEGRYTYQ